MDDIAQILLETPLATAFGTMGLLCQLTWPMFRRRNAILTVQFGVGANYSLQYALLDAWSGAGVAGLGAIQTLLALFAGDRPWLRRAGFLFLPVVAAVCFATWSGIASLFALSAVTLIMVGRLQRDTLCLRILLLSAAPFGIGYDVLVGALPALIGAISSAIIATSMLVREIRLRRRTVAQQQRAHDTNFESAFEKRSLGNA